MALDENELAPENMLIFSRSAATLLPNDWSFDGQTSADLAPIRSTQTRQGRGESEATVGPTTSLGLGGTLLGLASGQGPADEEETATPRAR